MIEEQNPVSESDRWAEYERRLKSWLVQNPGALVWEIKDFAARLRQELGL